MACSHQRILDGEEHLQQLRSSLVLLEVAGDVGQQKLQDGSAQRPVLHEVEVLLQDRHDLGRAHGLGGVHGDDGTLGGQVGRSLFQGRAGAGRPQQTQPPAHGRQQIAIAPFVQQALWQVARQHLRRPPPPPDSLACATLDDNWR